ncbi:hypothetical protein P4S60_18380 [Pseudoalteromonas sp. Hal040]|uniref:hypothetical protein n=1 Tax=unclassified Pseudoalteromonas TaxID=194690 RepID=UPI00301CC59B
MAGINCWDTNGDRVNDQSEDVNFDGQWNAADCQAAQATSQNHDAEFNHQHICEALANLGQYPQGCPSAAAVPPSGTLTKLYENTSANWYDDGANGYTSCNTAPNDGLLKIVTRDDLAFFEAEEVFIASVTRLERANETLNDTCYNTCNSDPKCVASLARTVTSSDGQAMDCVIFYHSDTVANYERVCGANTSVDVDARDICRISSGAQNRWSARCP